MTDTAPLVLTLVLEPVAQAWLDDLRRRHFPAERNHLPAHVTLFHAVPGEGVPEVLADVRAEAPGAPLPMTVTRVRSLGRGVAYDLEGAEATALRAALARRWRDSLTPQDARPWRAHVTVQNKVDSATARALHARLAAGFAPVGTAATGLAVWRYRGGPWEPVAEVPFGPG